MTPAEKQAYDKNVESIESVFVIHDNRADMLADLDNWIIWWKKELASNKKQFSPDYIKATSKLINNALIKAGTGTIKFDDSVYASASSIPDYVTQSQAKYTGTGTSTTPTPTPTPTPVGGSEKASAQLSSGIPSSPEQVVTTLPENYFMPYNKGYKPDDPQVIKFNKYWMGLYKRLLFEALKSDSDSNYDPSESLKEIYDILHDPNIDKNARYYFVSAYKNAFWDDFVRNNGVIEE